MRRFALIFLLWSFFDGRAQNVPGEFGKLSEDEIKMALYGKDSSAAAVILFDKAESRLDIDLTVIYKRHTRIKFFSKEAIDTWATETIFLDRSSESLSKLKASVYNLDNGRVIESKMEESSVFKTKIDRYTDQVKFTLPNVKEGSIIEYSYTLRSQASLLPGWQFQYTIPSIFSEYEIFIPSTFSFRKDMQGFLSVDDHWSNEARTHERWTLRDVPAFKEEPFLTTPQDYVSKISFFIDEVFVPGQPLLNFRQTWRGIVKNLNEEPDFGVQIRASSFLKKIAEEQTQKLNDPIEKLTAIYSFVKANVQWNEITDKIPDRPFKKVLEEKKGSSSEINLLLVSMLKKADLEAYPVLISTRNHGRIRRLNPSFGEFNDVICLAVIGEKRMLLDGTDRNLPMESLPERCLNGEGLIVAEEGAEWIPTTAQRKARTIVNSEIKIDHMGVITGKLTINQDGLDGGVARKSFGAQGKDEYVMNSIERKPWQIVNSDFANMDTPNEPVKEQHEVTITDHTQVSGEMIYLNPYLLQRMEENVFKSENRNYPIDFSSPFDKFYFAKIEIPEGYKVDEIPATKIFALPDNGGKFIYSITQSGNFINLVSQLTIFKRVFMPEEYINLREFYSLVVAKQAEQIVLKKK